MTLNQQYKGTITHFSLHRIHEQGVYGFDPEAYSKFKYGAENIAQTFGYDLANGFISECLSKNYDGRQIVVLPSAYSHIPTASFFMKNYFVDKLNDYLYENNYPITEETKIHRTVTYREDYGEMSAEERYRLIKGDRFYIDKDFVVGKTILLLDDVKITGTHERIIVNMLNSYNLDVPCYMLYFAELVNDLVSPTIENSLNNAFVKSLRDVDYIIRNERFTFNTRVVKFILNSNEAEFDEFIRQRDIDFINALYYNAIGNEYFQFPSYMRNLLELKSLIK